MVSPFFGAEYSQHCVPQWPPQPQNSFSCEDEQAKSDCETAWYDNGSEAPRTPSEKNNGLSLLFTSTYCLFFKKYAINLNIKRQLYGLLKGIEKKTTKEKVNDLG